MRRRNEGKKLSSSSSSSNCDVGLGLRMHLHPTHPSYACDGAAAVSFPGYSSSSIHGAVPLPRTGGMGMGVFSAPQLEELERQKMIHKYIMASIPVPPELLQLPNSSLSTGLELRYSSGGSDAEPWRCKRTDGKKWRCSRDVAPDHKYCDRHAHKSKPRSRKHVEPPPPHSNHLTPHHNNTDLQPPLHSQLPRMESAASYDQSRCIEWFIRGGATNSSTESKGTDDNNVGSSILGCLETKRLIDGWDNRELDGVTKFSPNSLTLSMPGLDDDHQDSQESSYIGMMMMNPGGPLGEALCLGNARRGVASSHHKGSCEDDSHALNFIG